jgi:Domain of unknown function (DUF3854)
MTCPAQIGVRSISDGRAELSQADIAALERCWIDRDLVSRAQLFRVNGIDGSSIIGRNGQRGDYAGIVFPYIWPGQPGARSYRLRRDNPDIEVKGGKQFEKGKYLCAPGDNNRLYVVPGTPVAQLSSCELPAVFVEGEKKTLAGQRLAEYGNVTPRFLPVGLGGVWSWRGSTGKTTGPSGERRDTKGPIPDLSRITLAGRIVYILFDVNCQSNSSVAAARNQLALELTARGAEVSIVELPPSDGVNGIDDFLGKYGPEAGLKLFEDARPFDPKKELARLDHTDHGNERAFEILFGDEYRYNWTSKQWLQWNGVFWSPDVINSIDRRMLKVAAERLDATALLPELDAAGNPLRKNAIAAALRLRNVRTRQAAMASATSNERFAYVFVN